MAAGSKSKSTGRGKYVVGAAIVVFLLEVFVLGSFLRKRDQNTSMNDSAAVSEAESADDWREVVIGSYEARNRSFSDAPVRVVVEVYARVPRHNVRSLASVLNDKRNRIDDAVRVVLRQAHFSELKEGDARSIKRKMHVALNEVLGSDSAYITELIFPKFDTHQVWH